MEAWKEELYHEGIKGMKWGVRRYQNEDGTLTPAGKRRYAKLKRKLNALNSGEDDNSPVTVKVSSNRANVKNMSDDDLRDAISRLRMEKEFEKLMSEPSSQSVINSGKNEVSKKSNSLMKDILTQSAKTIGGQLLTYALGTAVNRIAANHSKPSPLDRMSDADLDAKISRMEKEKKYRDLISSSHQTQIVNPKKGQKDK